ncbi:LacI family DNA-binding transcriptional regulator [Collinsella tanakaei]|uniref:LacI family DNA-binding transcriptional regulator n=1 Tax=Collinsella tanakaei TaxID=626935 RepID=UPI0025A4A384|nr:LacI family DNA-binding transcriptional regulator [Collinsella tanakaei]MDM8300364.1 LacI family DNA-binding transcriptional regulator [Collinsella tanakaei]
MANKVTLKQIAREVGLSPASVSLVLNNRPCRISEENRRRIKEVASREHYIPNQIARSLVTQQSKTLGLIVPNIESRFFSSLAKNLEQRCRAEGYALFITNSDGLAENDLELLNLLVTRGVDGLFLVVSDEAPDDRALFDELSSLTIPYVMVDRVMDELPCDKVMFDHELGGYMATRYLLQQGHRRIACMVNAAKTVTGRKRLSGYLRALRESGMEPDLSLVVESEYYISSAYEAAEHVLASDATAVFASSDNITLGLLKRLHENGQRVPRDYSLVSYDNSAADALFEPSLTSIEQNVSELSHHAVRLMMRRLGNPGIEPVERVLKPHLVIKESVASLADDRARMLA